MDKLSSDPSNIHVPVLLKQAIELLNITAGRTWVDATTGLGGHLAEIFRQAGPNARVFGIDQDKQALALAAQRLALLTASDTTSRLKLLAGNFADIRELLQAENIENVNGGILADLGVSSLQFDFGERGFSFQQDGPLDMRMNQEADLSAYNLVNELESEELANIIWKYGEERFSRPIAREITKHRPIKTTAQLAQVISSVVRRLSKQHRATERIHPATRTFQAIRIAVNNELVVLEKFLNEAINLLAPGGTLAVITFHSLEDRLVKHFFKLKTSPCICPPRFPICNCGKKSEVLIKTPKAIVPDSLEILANPRARSAKLRAVEKLS